MNATNKMMKLFREYKEKRKSFTVVICEQLSKDKVLVTRKENLTCEAMERYCAIANLFHRKTDILVLEK